MGITIADCMLCELRQRPCSGACVCTVNGQDIGHNAVHGCPAGKVGRFGTTPPPKPIEPLPRQDWPKWATWIAGFYAQDDIGVGDTVHRKLGKAGEWTKAILKAAGVPCGCSERRERWNKMYPYSGSTTNAVT